MTAKSLYLSQCHRWFQLARLHGFCSLVYSLQRSSWMGDGWGDFLVTIPQRTGKSKTSERDWCMEQLLIVFPWNVSLIYWELWQWNLVTLNERWGWLMQMCLPLNDPIIRRVCDQLWNCWRGWYEFLIKSSNVLRCESNAHPIDVVICLWWVFFKRFR